MPQGGVAPVTRPLDEEGLVPLAKVMGVSITTGPVSVEEPVKPVPALPTEAQVKAAEVKAVEDARPKPLVKKPVQQVIKIKSPDTFVLEPEEPPMVTPGTVSGRMFTDETETLKPIATPDTVWSETVGPDLSQPEPTPPQTISLNPSPTDTAAQISPTDTQIPQTATPITAESPKQQPESPKITDIPPASIGFQADSAQLPSGSIAKIRRFAEGLKSIENPQVSVMLYTAAPPIGATAAEIGMARWAAVRPYFRQSGPKLPNTSIHIKHIKAKPNKQRLVLKVLN